MEGIDRIRCRRRVRRARDNIKHGGTETRRRAPLGTGAAARQTILPDDLHSADAGLRPASRARVETGNTNASGTPGACVSGLNSRSTARSAVGGMLGQPLNSVRAPRLRVSVLFLSRALRTLRGAVSGYHFVSRRLKPADPRRGGRSTTHRRMSRCPTTARSNVSGRMSICRSSRPKRSSRRSTRNWPRRLFGTLTAAVLDLDRLPALRRA